MQHTIKHPEHHMDYENVEIIDHAVNETKLNIKELLHILKRKPSLNRQMNSDFDITTIIIKTYAVNRDQTVIYRRLHMRISTSIPLIYYLYFLYRNVVSIKFIKQKIIS